ncbi:MAG TPA: helix-turn-helix domain-containing protein [Solirubrobacterales bacterium]|jgi:DNA-binding transcriptional ArsR family regulator
MADRASVVSSVGVSDEFANAVAGLATVFSHPLRIRIITALAAEPASATMLSSRFGDVSVSDCFYHFSALKKGGIVELVRSRKVRGAKERIYSLAPRSRWRDSQLLRPFIDALLAMSLETRAVTATTVPLVIDAQGFSEVAEVLRDTLHAVDQVADESQERLRDTRPEEKISAVVAVAAFEASKFEVATADEPAS